MLFQEHVRPQHQCGRPKGFIACICDPHFVVAVELDSVPQCTELGVRIRMGMLPRSIETEGRPTGNYKMG